MTTPDSQLQQAVENGQRKHSIAIRKPWHVPEDDLQLPQPKKMPSPPPETSVLGLAIAPAIMVLGSLIAVLVFKQGTFALTMLIGAMAYPVGNMLNKRMRQKNYEKKMIEREVDYQAALKQERARIEGLILQQKNALNIEYPRTEAVLAIGRAAGDEKRLWWRRRHDNDFLSLRLGETSAPPSFNILPPRIIDTEDPLANLPTQLIDRYKRVDNLPMMLRLRRAGSLVLRSEALRVKYEFAYRMLTDLLVHQSPEDVELALVSDREDAALRWSWLKWAPHTRVIETRYQHSNVNFKIDHINAYLFELEKLFVRRLEASRRYNDDQYARQEKALVLIFDDTGAIREKPQVAEWAALGVQVGIYCIFLGDRSTPNTCRARIDVDDKGGIRYIETWEAESSEAESRGQAEFCDQERIEEVVRSLAGLYVAGSAASLELPSLVRISEMLGPDSLRADSIIENWSRDIPQSEQLLFPLGYTRGQSGYEVAHVDFRPENLGGKGEYHAMLIGTTGSGKSILLQTMVLASAYKYSPRLLNFMFMDFKAGAEELGKIRDLPHVVGMVTDLDREAAERALQALENELARRQRSFKSASEAGHQITDIWDYNRKAPGINLEVVPHLLVVIDEFAEGTKLLPDLIERLGDLGRRGRAFGMYFFLANQEVNTAVDKLVPNVGWYVVLKVKTKEEMRLIDKELEVAPGQGRGYLRVKSDISTFQAGYAGAAIDVSNAGILDYAIFEIGDEGRAVRTIYDHVEKMKSSNGSQEKPPIELDVLLEEMETALVEMDIQAARRIYQDPVEKVILLDQLLAEAAPYRGYRENHYGEEAHPARYLHAPIGRMDIPAECVQPLLDIDFNQGTGSMWLKAPGGLGDTMALKTLMFSLARNHRPDEVWFYVLDYGDGSMRPMENLPHAGAVILEHEEERIDRLFARLESLYRTRRESDWKAAGEPHIFLFISSYISLREKSLQENKFERETQVINLMRVGKQTGIHVVLTSDRDVPNQVSANISIKMGIQAGDKDDYYGIVGRIADVPLPVRADGRGLYLSEEFGIVQSQVAFPPEGADLRQTIEAMNAAWDGPRPFAISELANEIAFADGLAMLPAADHGSDTLLVPIGVSFNTLDYVLIDLMEGHHYWSIIGPARSGKTNTLLALAGASMAANPDLPPPLYMSLKPGKTRQRLEGSGIGVLTHPEEMIVRLSGLVDQDKGQPQILLLDDLELTLVHEELLEALNGLEKRRYDLPHVFIFWAGNRDKMNAGQKIISLLKEYRTGIALSMDNLDHAWAGISNPIPMSVKKELKFPTGRAFLVINGEYQIVHIPNVEDGQAIREARQVNS